MAITIISTPKDYAPAVNKMVYTASSTNVGQTSFSYLVDVYIDGTKVIGYKIAPDINDYLQIDVNEVIQTYLDSFILPFDNVQGSLDDEIALINYQVKFGEEYEVTGTLTQYPDLTVDSTRYAINGGLDRNKSIDWDSDNYLADTNIGKYLTNAPLVRYTTINDHGELAFFNYDGLASKVIIVTYDDVDSILNTYEISANASSDLIKIPANPSSINNVQAGDILVGTQPLITDSIASYRLSVFDSSNNPLTELIQYKLQCENKARVHFLNEFGQFDSFNFTKRIDTNTKIERSTSKREVYNLDSGGNFIESKADIERVQHYVKTSKTLKLKSDWITEEENEWLKELISSPVTYLEDNGELIALEGCTVTTHESKNQNQDKLFNLELEFNFGYDNYRQRG